MPKRILSSWGVSTQPIPKPWDPTKTRIQEAIATALLALGVLALCHAGILGALTGIALAATTICILHKTMKFFRAYNKYQTAGMFHTTTKELHKFGLTPKHHKVLTFPTQNSKETTKLRLELVQQAQHRIIISGNYCGGAPFFELLDLLDQKMSENLELEVLILSSDKFLRRKERSRLRDLQKKHKNFSLVETPDVYDLANGKKVTNHSKFVIVDDLHVILGGSGIKPNFTKEALGKEEAPTSPSSSFLEKRILPGAFRDMDAYFQGARFARQMTIQALLLAYRWEQLQKKSPSLNTTELSQLPLISGNPNSTLVPQTLVQKMLSTRPHKSKHNPISPKGLSRATAQLSFSGPEHTKSRFGSDVLRFIETSKERLVINHMYFHPTPKIAQSIVEAAHRGVEITIITNGLYEHSPNSHKGFAPRNQFNLWWILSQLTPEERNRVSVYYIEKPKIGSHKKVIVADDRVLMGSSNFGYKSLQTSSDHEPNVLLTGKEVTNEFLQVFEQDKSISRPVSFEELQHQSLSSLLRVALHRLLAPLIG